MQYQFPCARSFPSSVNPHDKTLYFDKVIFFPLAVIFSSTWYAGHCNGFRPIKEPLDISKILLVLLSAERKKC